MKSFKMVYFTNCSAIRLNQYELLAIKPLPVQPDKRLPLKKQNVNLTFKQSSL